MAKKQPFTAAQFTATKFDTAAEKAKFANKLADFLLSGCDVKKYTNWLYRHLSLHFCSHIAHYDGGGFWHTWFADQDKRCAFIQRMVGHPCHGQPDYTFCDVERAMQSWYAENKSAVDAAMLNRMQAEQDAENAERKRHAAVADADSQEFIVARKSENTGSFGHRQYVVVAKDGSAYTIEIVPSNLSLNVGQVLNVPLKNGKPVWTKFHVECPNRLNDAPQNMVDEVWKLAAA